MPVSSMSTKPLVGGLRAAGIIPSLFFWQPANLFTLIWTLLLYLLYLLYFRFLRAVQASVGANTYVVSGQSETKSECHGTQTSY